MRSERSKLLTIFETQGAGRSVEKEPALTEHSKAATTEHFIPGHSRRRVCEYRSLFLLLQV